MRQKYETPKVGVCYVTAVGDPGADVSDLLVRLEMTVDVDSQEMTTRHARGPDAACHALRSWMTAMCRAKSGGSC